MDPTSKLTVMLEARLSDLCHLMLCSDRRS